MIVCSVVPILYLKVGTCDEDERGLQSARRQRGAGKVTKTKKTKKKKKSLTINMASYTCLHITQI